MIRRYVLHWSMLLVFLQHDLSFFFFVGFPGRVFRKVRRLQGFRVKLGRILKTSTRNLCFQCTASSLVAGYFSIDFFLKYDHDFEYPFHTVLLPPTVFHLWRFWDFERLKWTILSLFFPRDIHGNSKKNTKKTSFFGRPTLDELWRFVSCCCHHGEHKHTTQRAKIPKHCHLGVSKNRGTPKWMVYNGKPYQNGWFGGTIIFGNTHLWRIWDATIPPRRFFLQHSTAGSWFCVHLLKGSEGDFWFLCLFEIFKEMLQMNTNRICSMAILHVLATWNHGFNGTLEATKLSKTFSCSNTDSSLGLPLHHVVGGVGKMYG